ncbi:MucBP domain-containing protein, partial [Enterococcus ureasiticus]|uniref:MucBP domain-containing protein n=1 Tax=Enterococcus ureasiticus TaxID=903984 RepID=UPI000A6E0BE9
TTPENTKVMAVPVTVTTEDETVEIGGKAGLSYNTPLLKASEIKGKNNADIIAILTKRLAIKAWDLSSGAALTATITNAPIVNTLRGSAEITVTVKVGTESLTQPIRATVVPDDIFGDDEIDGWKNVPMDPVNPEWAPGNGQPYLLAQKDKGLINPINESRLGMPGRGSYDVTGLPTNDIGFSVVDSNDWGFVYLTQRTKTVPGKFNKFYVPLYDDYKVNIGGPWSSDKGVGYSEFARKNASAKYFLRKGDKIKEVVVDDANKVMYVYDLSLQKNLNFFIMLSMYNLSTKSETFALFEPTGLQVVTTALELPFYAIGDNNSGFSAIFDNDLVPQYNRRITLKLKDNKGNWLSDYTKYKVGDTNISGAVKPGFINLGIMSGQNYFGSSFTTPGDESQQYKDGALMYHPYNMSGYVLGAPWKSVEPDKAIKGGYEMFFGAELPYMHLNATPEEFNVYSDYAGDFNVDYKISSIPSKTYNGSGNLYATYPNGETVGYPFTGDDAGNANGSINIKDKLPKQLNDKVGTIKTYETSLIAVNELGAESGLPSEEEPNIKINAYAFGGLPIGQVVKKGSSWTKTAESLIKDPTILPGHTAAFEYVNKAKPVDTSKLGVQFAEVRMTDEKQTDKTVVIKVPVLVSDDNPLPSTGIRIGADDFSIEKSELAGKTKAELEALILEKSGAVGLDLATGATTGIDLSILNTTLTNAPDVTKPYTAEIQAKKGTATDKKTINITVTDQSTLAVSFVNEDNMELAPSINLTGNIGSKVDLTKNTDIQKAIKSQTDKGYVVTRPANEKAYEIDADENQTATYKFQTKSKLTINFVDENNKVILSTDTVNLMKEIGVPVDLTLEKPVQDIVKKYKDKGYKLLESPTPETVYPITATDQTISYKFQTKSKLTINFVDEANKVMLGTETLDLTKEIGVPVDLTLEKSVQDIVKKYKDKGYKLLESPTPETAYPITATDQTISYKFQTKSKLTINFVDEANQVMLETETLDLTKEIGVPVDLTLEKSVQDIVKKYKDKGYKLLESPTPENAYPITATDQTISYKFQTKSKLTINFVDEANQVMLGTETLDLTKEIGVPVDLTLEKSVQDIVKKYKDKGYKLLESPTPETAYPITAMDQTISYKFQTKSKLTVNFVDEANKVMLATETLDLTKEIGVPVDLTLEQSVQDIVKKYKDKGYKLLESPTPETAYPITATDQTISYKFQTKSKLTINFVDENDKMIKELELTRDIGTLDLTKDKDILAAIKTLKEDKYEVIESPENETNYPVRENNDPVVYKIKKTTTAVTINFVDEEGGNIADVEPIKLTEIIGSTLELGVEPLKT